MGKRKTSKLRVAIVTAAARPVGKRVAVVPAVAMSLVPVRSVFC